MTQSLYEQVRPYVTVYSGAEGVDPTRAPRPVLEALARHHARSCVEALLDGRPRGRPVRLDRGPAAPCGAREYFVPSRDLVFTIRALGRSSGGGNFLRQAVIELGASRDQPFLVLRLEPRDFARQRRLNFLSARPDPS